MRAALLAIAIVALVAVIAIGVTLLYALRRESEAWRATLATVLTTPLRVEVTHSGLPAALLLSHGLDAGAVDPVRRLIRVATMGREDIGNGRRSRGSPDPEAVAAQKIRDESVAGLAVRLKATYANEGVARSLEDCTAEALAMLNGARF